MKKTIRAVACGLCLLVGGCADPADRTPADSAARPSDSGGTAVSQLEKVAHNSQLPDRPYSQAVAAGDFVFLSGKVGVTEETVAMAEGRTAAETRIVMESFRELLAELRLDFDDIVQGTVFLADIGDYAEMNAVYAEYFPSDPPARETVAVKDIVGGAAVEISFVALRAR